MLRVAAVLIVVLVAASALLHGAHAGRILMPRLRDCRWGWLIVAALWQVGVYVCLAAILAGALDTLGKRLPIGVMLFTAIAFLFTTRGFAVAGLATLILLLGRRGVPADTAQAAAGTFYLGDYISFIALGGVVACSGGLAHSRVETGAALIVAAAVVGIVGAALRVPRACVSLASGLAGGVGRLLRWDPSMAAARAEAAVERFFDRWAQLNSRRRVLIYAALWGGLMHLCESATLVCASAAFGGGVSVNTAIAAYIAGNLAALITMIPGGVGVYDVAMAATLHTLGHVQPGTAVADTLAYRALSIWVPLPVVAGILREIARREPAPKSDIRN